MYKLIACDLDETLLNDDHVVPEENIKWIQKARVEKDVRFVPATGRGYTQIRPELKQLGLFDQPHEYTMSFNGGALVENKDEKIMKWQGLEFA
ncbi:MAG: HAD family hydrolase, partial [bacterium]